MISHSLITLPFMAVASLLIGPVGAALFITGWWWSREQYWAELRLREVGRRDVVRHVIPTIAAVWWPKRENMDLIAPAAVAWLLAAILSIAGV